MFSRPNYTQTPNEFFDEIAMTLKEGELRVLLVIMRQTFGWGNKRWDRISLSQFTKKTGMTEKSVIRSLKTLIEKKLVTKHQKGPSSNQESWYSLIVEDPSEFEDPIVIQNIFTPCPKDRPPSVLKTDTKETLPKERKESSLALAKEKSPSAPPPPSGHYKEKFEGKVCITEENFDRLLKKFGSEELLDEYAEKLYRWSFNNEKAFKVKKRHDMVLEDWIEKDRKSVAAKKPQEGTLNAPQQENWRLNQEVVQELKMCGKKVAEGLNWFYKFHVLKDKNRQDFDLSGLINHKDFCLQLEKHLKLHIVKHRFPNG
jgi:phage replication O-like protein O